MEGVLVALAVLACPVGMAVMGWMMVKGMSGDRETPPTSIDELRAEHNRLGAEIERIEDGRTHDQAPALRS